MGCLKRHGYESRVLAITHATLFNGDISNWDVSSVNDMNRMLTYATSFDGDVLKWDVSKVQNMTDVFRGVKLFNSDISTICTREL